MWSGLLFFLLGLIQVNNGQQSPTRSRGCSSRSGKPCVFPFFYNGTLYDECSPIKNTANTEDELLYCSVLNGETYEAIQIEPCSGQCQNRQRKCLAGQDLTEECVFPVKYNRRTYWWCSMADHGESWCAVSTNKSRTDWWVACPKQCLGYEPTIPTCPTKKGKACQFPFVWQGHLYSECTKDDHEEPWCATSLDFEGGIGSWDACDSSCPGYNSSLAACKTTRSKKSCKFPFLYRGVSQHSCLMLDPSQPSGFWCSVANFPNGTVRAWDTCNNQCPTSSNQDNDDFNQSSINVAILILFIISLIAHGIAILVCIFGKNPKFVEQIKMFELYKKFQN